MRFSSIRRLFARPASRAIRKAPRRTRLNIEQLEHRLTPSALGITFDDGIGPLAELPILNYSWGADNPSAGTGTASLQNFTLTLAPTSAEPGLWGHLAAGSHLDSATIHVRNFAGTEYLTYTLTNVTIVSFSTGAIDDGSAPQDTMQLDYDSVRESYRPISRRDGTLGTANVAEYNQKTGTNGGSGSLNDPSAGTPDLGLTFDIWPELEVASYSWGGAGAGPSSLQNFTLTLAPTLAEPALWGHLAVPDFFHESSATIHVRHNTGSALTEYLTYTLTNVTITSFSSSLDADGRAQDTIQLAYDSVSESYRPIKPDGTLGRANIAQFDRTTNTSTGSGSLADPSAAASPPVGLLFSGFGVTELSVASYSWGASNPSGNTDSASLQNFTLTLSPTSAEPGLWGRLAAGSHLDSAAIHVRNSAGTEYLSYTLTNVTITSFSTGNDGFDRPQDTIQLTYDSVSESYSPITPLGKLGKPETAQYNLLTGAGSATGSIYLGPVATNTTTILLSTPQQNIIYNADGSVTVTVTSPGGTPTGTVQLSVDGTPLPSQTLSNGSATFTVTSPSAGAHPLHAVYAAQGNFLGSFADGTLTVDQASSTTTLSDAGGTYDGATMFAATFSVSGAGTITGAASVDYYDNTTSTDLVIDAPIDAGNYTVVVTYAGDLNHGGSSNFATFTIAQATLTVTADARIKTQGQQNPTLTASYNGFVPGETLATSGVSGSPLLLTSADLSSPEGSYSIAVGLGTLASANYNFQLVNSVLFVTSAASQLTSFQSVAVSGTGGPVSAEAGGAGDNVAQVTATGSGFDGTLTVAQFDGAPNTGFGTAGATFDVNVQPQIGTNLGSAAALSLQFQNLTPNAPLLWWDGSAWTEVRDGSGRSVVADASGAAAVTLTNSTAPTLSQLGGTYFLAGQVQPLFDIGAQQITYGTAAVTFSGTFTAGGLIPNGDTVTASLGGQTQTATVQADGGFSVTFNSALLGASPTAYTIHYNYAGSNEFLQTSASSPLTVTKADATVNVAGYTGVYDAAYHGAAGSESGVGGEDAGMLTLGGTFKDVPGGTAHWVFTGNGNYKDQSGDVAIAIGKATAAITVTPYSITYDGHAHTATDTARGVNNVDLSSGLTLSGTTRTDAGTYNGDGWSFAGGTNYNDASGTVNDSIAQALLTVTVGNASKVYGQDDSAALTGTITGIQGNDPITAAYASFGSAATAAPGSYAIDAVFSDAGSGKLTRDYRVTILPATLTVTKDSTTVQVTSSAGTVNYSQSVTFTATLTVNAPGSGTPTGTVSFYDGTTLLATSTPSGGAATYTAAKLGAGSHAITVRFNGDVDFLGSTSAAFTQTVLSAAQQVTRLFNRVDALVTSGVLNGGDISGLTAKLNSATASLNTGNVNAGVNQLNAFINQVNALVNSRRLTKAQAQTLLDAANQAIASALA